MVFSPHLAASAPRHSTSALEARNLRGLRHGANRGRVAETGSEAHDLPPRFSHGRGDGRIHSLGRCHIGGCAYFVWALPPKVVGTVQRTVADAVIETSFCPAKVLWAGWSGSVASC